MNKIIFNSWRIIDINNNFNKVNTSIKYIKINII